MQDEHTIVPLAEALSGVAPGAVRGMQRPVEIERGALDEVRAAEEILACFAFDDIKEGLAAFAERRKADFTGR